MIPLNRHGVIRSIILPYLGTRDPLALDTLVKAISYVISGGDIHKVPGARVDLSRETLEWDLGPHGDLSITFEGAKSLARLYTRELESMLDIDAYISGKDIFEEQLWGMFRVRLHPKDIEAIHEVCKECENARSL